MKKGILIHEANDDVGVAVMDLKKGEQVDVVTLEGRDVKQIVLVTDIPLGHKVSMTDLPLNKHVIEYGREIGYVVAPIRAGEHVHIHNIKSLRWAASQADVLAK